MSILLLIVSCGGGEPSGTSTQEADENYPDQATSWIVPFSAGGGADSSFRMFMKYADEISKESMSVVNVEGAGGVTGWTQFLRSEPDGYTLSLATPPFNVIPKVLQPAETPYELEDFQYLCVFAVSPNALLVREDDDRFKTLADVITYAKANPGEVIAAGDGAASPDAIHRYQLEGAAGVEFTYVSGDSAGNAQKLLAKDIDIMFSDMSWAQLQAGKIKGIAVASDKPHPDFPDVQTYQDAGYDITGARLRAPAAPPGTPANVISYWQDICKQVTEDEAFVEELGKIGQPVQFMDSKAATAFVQDMKADIEEIVEKHGLEAEG